MRLHTHWTGASKLIKQNGENWVRDLCGRALVEGGMGSGANGCIASMCGAHTRHLFPYIRGTRIYLRGMTNSITGATLASFKIHLLCCYSVIYFVLFV